MKESASGVRSSEPVLRKSGRGSSLNVTEDVPKSKPLRVLHPEFRVGFVIGERVNLARSEIPHFRARNVIAALEPVGMGGFWCYEPDALAQIEQLLSCDIIVLVRGAMTLGLERIIEKAWTNGIPVVFDIDDYCFTRLDPKHLAAARRYSPDEIEDYNDAADRYCKTLSCCRYFTASTTPLAGQGEKLGLRSYVLRNTLNEMWLKATDQINAQKAHKRHEKEVTIGYFPGTVTHQRDFKQALPAILRIIDEYGETRLLLTEMLELREFPELRHYRSRVDVVRRVHWSSLACEIARVDINIAPLELDEFCQSKSELKYFQAGALSIPSIVTPTIPYREAIENGVNGLLASDESEWYEHLSTLITDEELRREIGRNARKSVLRRYAPETLRDQAISAYADILGDSFATAP